MRRVLSLPLLVLLTLPATACAQHGLTVQQQIALAVLPMPKVFQADATVLGYNAKHQLVKIRDGKGVMTCLAPDPKDEKLFHVACYHNSLEPFMARRRALRASGAIENVVDSMSYAEIQSGKLPMPKQAALWQMTGPYSAVDIKNATVSSAVMPMYVVYTPYATAASTGLPDQPVAKGPWLMLPGTPKAHIMFMPSMDP
jgi:hypothetical protein